MMDAPRDWKLVLLFEGQEIEVAYPQMRDALEAAATHSRCAECVPVRVDGPSGDTFVVAGAASQPGTLILDGDGVTVLAATTGPGYTFTVTRKDQGA